ncbi:hypothetical protein OTSUT76_2083 [Orientia tsutsugamushi str. UT76]|nr:hypothetical protein OTSUT76_2083 [Orientia tsutsugamushi str. UT76]
MLLTLLTIKMSNIDKNIEAAKSIAEPILINVVQANTKAK